MRKIALSFVVVSCVAVAAYAGKYNTAVSVGDKAPDFSGIPAIENGEQKSLTLSDIKEPVVVVVFLANHCPVVQGYEDRVIDFTNDYKDKGVKVVGIAVSTMSGDKIPGIKDYMKEHKSTYIYGYDESRRLGRLTVRPRPRSSSSSTRSGRSATPARWTTTAAKTRSARPTSAMPSMPF
jgi:peroxiredoxin